MIKTLSLSVMLAFLLFPKITPAQEAVFPAKSGIVDVTKAPYEAKGDGKTDDTKAIQKAFDDHPNEGAIIYLPNGTYLITDTIKWPKGNRGGMEEKNTILQGQSREKTFLKLKDKCEGFQDPTKSKAMVWTGKAPAQRFRNAIRDITIDIGKENSGAIGAQFMANNQGTMLNVTVQTPDQHGLIGIDMIYTNEIGPCLLKKVKVIGFETGIKIGHAVDSITMEDITLEQQRKYGLSNDGQVLTIRKLQSTNAVPAIFNAKGPSFLTLLDSELVGVGDASKLPAIVNDSPIFARNVNAKGYSKVLENSAGDKKSPEGLKIDEFTHSPAMGLFANPKKSLNLPVEETPEVKIDDPETWESVTKHGAGGNDYNNREKNDDTAAFQKAIDAGKTTVVVPRGFYVLNDTVKIRGKVRTIIFMESQLVAGKGFKGSNKPVFRFEDGDEQTVVLDRMSITYGSQEKVWLEHACKRTLVIKNSMIGQYESVGGGKLFLEDICGGPFFFRKQTVYARQLNQETEGTHVVNDGGQLWILGYKTERGGTLLETKNGGKTEVLGCFAYCTTGVSKEPMFVVTDSQFSANMGEAHFGGRFDILVKETQKGETKNLNRKDAQSRYGIGALLPLYVSGRE